MLPAPDTRFTGTSKIARSYGVHFILVGVIFYSCVLVLHPRMRCHTAFSHFMEQRQRIHHCTKNFRFPVFEHLLHRHVMFEVEVIHDFLQLNIVQQLIRQWHFDRRRINIELHDDDVIFVVLFLQDLPRIHLAVFIGTHGNVDPMIRRHELFWHSAEYVLRVGGRDFVRVDVIEVEAKLLEGFDQEESGGFLVQVELEAGAHVHQDKS
mmetsp:Transcript_67/g.181  ORF Transcript_67/g.181 Transcript_67/m.181 type:complete len:208 (+) Transcript_67:192-815(+)